MPMLKPEMTQYNVQFPNEGRRLEKLTQLLMKEKVDFKSVLTASSEAKTSVQFLARKNPTLREKLEKLGIEVREDQIFQLELPNDRGELHKVANALAERSINIISLYSTIEGDKMRLVLAVDEPANAVAAIQKLGFEPDYLVDER
jgi:hypothetical protein